MKYRFRENIGVILLGVCLIFIGCGKGKDQKFKESDQTLSQAHVSFDHGKYIEVIKTLQNSITLNQELGRDSVLGECYYLLAQSLRQLGQYDSALVNFHRSLESFQMTGDKQLQTKGKITLAQFLTLIGDDNTSLALALDASVTAKVFSDNIDRYNALNIVADAYNHLGKYEEQIRTIDELLSMDSTLHVSRYCLSLMIKKLQAWEAMGRHDQASEVFDEIKRNAELTQNDSGLVQAYYTWGFLQQQSDHPDSALRALSFAVSRMDKQMDRTLQTNILTSLGCLAYRSRQFENARMYFVDALALSRQNGNPVMENLLQLILIACDWKFSSGKSMAPAPEFLQRTDGVQIASEQNGFHVGEATALFLKAHIHEMSSDTTDVSAMYKQALGLYEDNSLFFYKRTIESEIINSIIEGENSGWYDPSLRLYCSQQNIQEVFYLNERKNLKEVHRFFSQIHITTTNDNLNKSIENYQRKYVTLQFLEKDIFDEISLGQSENTERLQELNKLLPMRFSETLKLMNDIGGMNQNFQWLVSTISPNFKRIQDSLQIGSTLLEYIPTSSALYILVIKHDTTYIRKYEYNRSRLIDLIHEFLKILSDPRFGNDNFQWMSSPSIQRLDELSTTLGKILIEPIQSLLKDASKLYIVPPEEFQWLPFHTLRVNGKAIAEQLNVSYLPTASAILFSQKEEGQVHKVVGMGYPGHTDWDVEYELKDIRSFYDSAMILVNQSAVLENLRALPYDVLHFATEFVKDKTIPNRTGFILSDGKTSYGWTQISLGETFKIVPTQAIIFSNVSTVAGGLSLYAPLAFLANSTPTVIATMWNGDRKTKRYFGEMFYTSLRGGLTVSQAYSDAIIAMTKKSEFTQLHKWGLYYRFGK